MKVAISQMKPYLADVGKKSEKNGREYRKSNKK